MIRPGGIARGTKLSSPATSKLRPDEHSLPLGQPNPGGKMLGGGKAPGPVPEGGSSGVQRLPTTHTPAATWSKSLGDSTRIGSATSEVAARQPNAAMIIDGFHLVSPPLHDDDTTEFQSTGETSARYVQ